MFLKDTSQIKYVLLNRDLDRKDGSGKEKWLFEVKGKEFIFTGDIKFLPKQKERVIIVDFCEKQQTSAGIRNWELTGKCKYWSNLVYCGVIELCYRRLPSIRKYRYIAICGDSHRKKLHTRLVNRQGAAPDNVVNETIPFLNKELQFLIDMGICHCVICDMLEKK